MTMNEHTRNLPMPSPDQGLYDAVLAEGFSRFPERRANYDRACAARRGETLDYLPLKLDIESVSRCNYRCTMCQVSDWPKMTRAADMTVDDFKALLDQQVGVYEIKLQGMGEPLLAADPFFEMIAYARSRSIWVRATINGSLLHLKDNYRRIIDSDICELQVSIDGTSAESYESIRRGGKFDRVVENCKLLNAYAREVGKHRTRMWVVVQRANMHEFEGFPELAADMGFSRLTLSLDLNDWGQDKWRQVNDSMDVQQAFDRDKALALVEKGRARNVDVTYWYIDRKYDGSAPSRLCPWPFERAYISSDMRVVPCCMVATPTIADFGDARDLTSVWHSDTMSAFRRAHLHQTIPDYCKSCYANDK
jgi:MoaA/NifB/PqqE/SkfB family radical SAM enzyme